MIISAGRIFRKSIHFRKATFASSAKKTSLEKQKILSKTLYKQILKWTSATGTAVPFDPIPPLTLIPPRVDDSALETIARLHNHDHDENEDDALTLEEKHLSTLVKSLPSSAIIEPSKLVIPIENAHHVKNATRLAYAMNNFSEEARTDLDQIKSRVSLSFEVLKSLNQLSEMLETRKNVREEHRDRDGVLFHVGQVVRHKSHRWRAIIGGWTKKSKDEKETSQRTSLTNKDYCAADDANSHDEIEYIVHLDEGDAQHARTRVLGSTKVGQGELELVDDDALKRIRNSLLRHHFDSFNAISGEYVPGNILKFEYPEDGTDSGQNILEETKMEILKHENAKIVLKGVKDVASRLHRVVLDTTSCPEARKIVFISDIEKKLQEIITGEFEKNVADQIDDGAKSSHKLAIQHLNALLNLWIEISNILWQRKTAEDNKDRVLFPLGTMVKHKKYGFRGVVVTWDPYPKADVSNWDGLRDIKGDVNKMVFYHVIPDLKDTVQAFGQERPFRYVCQENLELCPENESDIEINLEEGWSASEGEFEFKAPDELKFCHAEDIGEDDHEIFRCLTDLQKNMNETLIEIREGKSKERASDDDNCIRLDLKDMFQLLHNTECLEDAFVAEEGIKEIWKAHNNQKIKWSLDDGIAHLLRGDKSSALNLYDKIVEKDDPKYVEAWNKKATCHYMLGEMPRSIDAAKNASMINDMHFQAYAGLGLVYNDTNQYEKAADAFRKALSLNPWSPVASKLNVCLDTIKRLHVQKDDKSKD